MAVLYKSMAEFRDRGQRGLTQDLLTEALTTITSAIPVPGSEQMGTGTQELLSKAYLK